MGMSCNATGASSAVNIGSLSKDLKSYCWAFQVGIAIKQGNLNGIPVEVSALNGLEHRAAAVAADDVRGV
jgi:hypothetical protein